MIYINFVIYDLINLNFNSELLNLFTLDFTQNQKMQEFLELFINTEEELNINKYLRRKKFINLLEDCGIIEQLNNLYKSIIDFLNKEIND